MTVVTQKFKHNILALSVVFTVSARGGSDKVYTLLDDLISKDKSATTLCLNLNCKLYGKNHEAS